MALDGSGGIGRGGRTSTPGILLLSGCALLDCAAQLLLKHAANTLSLSGLLAGEFPWGIVFGYVLYAISAVLLVLGLQRGELSILYPILATTYIWIVLLSPLFFPTDSWTAAKFIGVSLIATGVALIGSARKR